MSTVAITAPEAPLVQPTRHRWAIALALVAFAAAGIYVVFFAKPAGWSVSAIPCDPAFATRPELIAALGQPLGCEVVSTKEHGSIRIYGPSGTALATSARNLGSASSTAYTYRVTLPDGSVVTWTTP